MPKELLDLTVEEISLVDQPANPGAQMLIYKRVSKNEEMGYATCKKCGAQMSKDATKCPECGTPVASETGEPNMSIEEAKAAQAKAEADLKAAEELATEEQKKREAAEAEVGKLKLELTKARMTPEAAEQKITKLEAELKIARMSPEERKKAERAELPESVRKQLEDSETQIAKLTDAAETVEFTKRAAELKLKGVTPEKLAPVFKRIAKGQSNTEDLADLERLMKSLSEQARLGNLFGEFGKGGNESGEPRAADRVMARVKELQKADPKLSTADATNLVFKADESLYREYAAETRGQA